VQAERERADPQITPEVLNGVQRGRSGVDDDGLAVPHEGRGGGADPLLCLDVPHAARGEAGLEAVLNRRYGHAGE